MSNDNGTSLAVKERTNLNALSRYGSEDEIKLLMERSASIFGIEKSEVNRPDVQASLVKATQYSIGYGLMPGIHVHMIPFKKKINNTWVDTYSPDLGEKAWKEFADRIAFQERIRYFVQTEQLTPDEVEEITKTIPDQPYSPEDAGFRARVLRSDHADFHQQMGVQYNPSWSYGFWRKKATKNYQGKWSSDSLPNQRMPADVAERRAYKAALMKAFKPVPLDDFEEERRFRKLNAFVEEESAIVRDLPQARALMAEDAIARDEDGMLLWGEGDEARTIDPATGEILDDDEEGQFRDVDDDLPDEIPFMGDDPDDHPFDDSPAQPDAPSRPALNAMHAEGTKLHNGAWDDVRHAYVHDATLGRTESSKELTRGEYEAVMHVLTIDSLCAQIQREDPSTYKRKAFAWWCRLTEHDYDNIFEMTGTEKAHFIGLLRKKAG